eukprot:Platyproteum_vivax@DN4759_c0_g1_i1.p1
MLSKVLSSSKQCWLRTAAVSMQRRTLYLHEYLSKELMHKYDINVQKGHPAMDSDEAYEVAKWLKEEGARDLIVKSQILAGGRGKGQLSSGLKGGVKVCQEPEQVKEMTEKMIGYNLVTHQTGPEGQPVAMVLVHEGVTIEKELYLAIVLDRKYNGPVLVTCQEGGVDIEEVAARNPESISVIPVDIVEGMTHQHATAAAVKLGIPEHQLYKVVPQIERLYRLFADTDATQLEINPLAITNLVKGDVMMVDAKINFDDNAKYRQEALFENEDDSMKDPREAAADAAGLNYVGLDGNIGCMVNGAGLAMATMDIIKLHGGSPANFLDVGGGAETDQVIEAFKIIQKDPKVKAVLVNIFGGIMKCDIIANGIIEAAKSVGLTLPLVVRLNGTNVDIAKKLLAESQLKCQVVDDLEEAAKTACQLI